MGRFHIYIDDKIEEEVRKRKMRKKGDLSKYIEELIKKDLKIK